MKNQTLGESFYHAFEGLSHVLWTQRNVRVQLMIFVLALVLCYVMRLNATQVMFVLSAAGAVLIAEFFNTAVEAVVDMITDQYHPQAKIAKDVAAGGVLIASLYALIVAGTVFINQEKIRALLGGEYTIERVAQQDPVVIAILVLVGIGIVSILVALAKVRVGHGSILRGGAVSGHTAVAFLLFAGIIIYSKFNILISILALVIAILVAQSRVEGKIHTITEVLWGAMVALLLMALLLLFT